VVGVAALLGRPAVVVVVLAAQVVIAVLGRRLLPSADRWALLGAAPAPLASLALAAAAGGHLGLRRLALPAVLVTALAAAAVLVIVTELVRAGADSHGEPVAAGQGRIERLSENLTLAVFALSPALLLAVSAGSGARRWWFALGVAGVAAGIGVRLGGSIVRAGGLSAGELLRSPHRAAELLRLPVARAVVVDVVMSVVALLVTGGLLAVGQVDAGDLWLPGLLALVATPMVLAGATTVLGLRAPVSAGVLASGLGLALSAPLALLLSVRSG
jgi:hypothetical protein